MTLYLPPLTSRKRGKMSLRLLAAAVMTLGAYSSAMAMHVGYSRIVSAPDAPLQIVVRLEQITPRESLSLQISLADEAAWARANLMLPVPLNSWALRIENTGDPSRKFLRLQSTQPLSNRSASFVDLLLNVKSSAEQGEVQITMTVPDFAADAQAEGVAAVTAGDGQTTRAINKGGVIQVRPKDTVYAIARRHAVPGTSVYQMMVALWQGNPQAFIQNNMNLVKTGAQLAIPDDETVHRIDPAQARAIFNEQVKAYAAYRARFGAKTGAETSVVKAQSATAGKLSEADDSSTLAEASNQDRLKLSAASGATNAAAQDAADARTSNAHAMADAAERLNQLQNNVGNLAAAVERGGVTEGSPAKTGNNAEKTGKENPSSPSATQADGAANANPASSTSNGSAAQANGASSSSATQANGTSNASATQANGSASSSVTPASDTRSNTASAAEDSNAANHGIVAKVTAQLKQSLPADIASWLIDHLLVIATAVFALFVLIIAWLLRVAGARNDDDEDSELERVDADALDRKLQTINLDLNVPPTDHPKNDSGSKA